MLEFDEVNLDRLRSHETITATGGYRFPETLPPFCLATREDYARLPLGAHQHLVTINAILEEARLHFGYRSANEIALFMTIFNDLLPPSTTDTDWLRALGRRRPPKDITALVRESFEARNPTRESEQILSRPHATDKRRCARRV